jgi:broad specificity phosphatase PhoE
MRRVYLVRHASPAIRPEQPSREWALSERGIEEARTLARVAKDWDIRAIYCGDEPKMRTTALILSETIGAPVHAVDAFDELRIGGWVANADEFNDLVRAILEGDASLPRGTESASAAAARFHAGLRIVEGGDFPALIVSGGRLLTAYLSRRRGVDEPFSFWRTIPFPKWTAIDLDAPDEAVQPFR